VELKSSLLRHSLAIALEPSLIKPSLASHRDIRVLTITAVPLPVLYCYLNGALMPAHKSKWTEQYGEVECKSYRLPTQIITLIDELATQRGQTKTDVIIHAILQMVNRERREVFMGSCAEIRD
jgi:hypothetical protein